MALNHRNQYLQVLRDIFSQNGMIDGNRICMVQQYLFFLLILVSYIVPKTKNQRFTNLFYLFKYY